MVTLYSEAKAYQDRLARIKRRNEHNKASYKRSIGKKYSEKIVAQYLRAAVKKFGESLYHQNTPNSCIVKMHPLTDAGIPDYLIHARGKTFYIETKTTGEPCTEIQIARHLALKNTGIEVYVLDMRVSDYMDIWTQVYQTYKRGKYYYRNPHVKHEKSEE